jgi:predicted nucleic acid-binding protein
MAPHLVRYELGNLLCKADLSRTQRADLLEATLVGVQFVDAAGAFDHAPPLTYCDAAYLAAASDLNATLVTYDEVLLKAARNAGVHTLQPK